MVAKYNKLANKGNDLIKKYNINIEVIIAELSDNETINALVKKINGAKNLVFLVNSAGYTQPRSKFNDQDITAYENMLTTHCEATIRLVYAALPNMIANRKGAIINVSSMMGFYPFRMQPMYTATKSFIAIFAESLNLELQGTGVKAQALCPGVTYSDFHKSIGIDEAKKARSSSFLWQSPMDPEIVVEKSLKYLEKNKVLCIPGFRNRLITMFLTLKRFFK